MLVIKLENIISLEAQLLLINSTYRKKNQKGENITEEGETFFPHIKPEELLFVIVESCLHFILFFEMIT